jgi:MFS family permease
MHTPLHREKLDFYQSSPRGKILRALTLSDMSYWAVDDLIAVILALFVVQFIEGGSATHLGLAFLAYKTVNAALSIPIGRFFDQRKGHVDEIKGLAFASFASGFVYMALSFGTQVWHLYASMIILGFLGTINLNSWRVLFYNNIKKEEYGETVGIYQAMMSIAGGLALALGGFFGDTFGFDVVVFYGGLVIALGGFVPLSIRYFVAKK